MQQGGASEVVEGFLNPDKMLTMWIYDNRGI